MHVNATTRAVGKTRKPGKAPIAALRGRGRGEMEDPARVSRQPGQRSGMFVRAIVVEHGMITFPAGTRAVPLVVVRRGLAASRLDRQSGAAIWLFSLIDNTTAWLADL